MSGLSVRERDDWKGQKVRKIWKILTAHVFQSFLRAKEYLTTTLLQKVEVISLYWLIPLHSLFLANIPSFQTGFAVWIRWTPSCYRSNKDVSQLMLEKNFEFSILKVWFLHQVSILSEFSVLKRAKRKTSGNSQFTTSMTQVQLVPKSKWNYFKVTIGIIA